MENQTSYEMKDYGKKSTFSGFLPGIAGVKGIPIWCCYVNRGQGVVSFGSENKDHAIMEYYPAHVAYQNVKRTGFRTFIRKNGTYFEAFSNEKYAQTMKIGMNRLDLSEENNTEKILTEVTYTILPEERVGALIRKVSVTNLSVDTVEVELCDGMPALIPYGVDQESVKNMTQTAKAWMQVEKLPVSEGKTAAVFRVRASMSDSASVSKVLGGNFSYSVLDNGEVLTAVTDPEAIFAYDLSLEKPVNFEEGGIAKVLAQKENASNIFPCSFAAVSLTLAPNETRSVYELIGQADDVRLIADLLNKDISADYFENKIRRAEKLTEEMTEKIAGKTADPIFDAYSRYTYMDNVLRGGSPIPLGHNKIYYVYSRKHGDLERDYNYFSMLPEFFSQGNGNFRDVNQNRRMDVFYSPFIERENINVFYSLIQPDGYNPLGVEKKTYRLEEKKAQVLLSNLADAQKNAIITVVTAPFTPGKLYECLQDILSGADAAEIEELFNSLIDFSESVVNGDFIEGYWSDHWDYNMDLVEEYLHVYPEKEKEMLTEPVYTWFVPQARVQPRYRRYAVTDNGIRQYYALDHTPMDHANENAGQGDEGKLLRADYQKGEVIHTTLMEKLILLSAVKYAALDPYGMGIEMEGGKPGWYDALNGLPGLLGSSMAETCELARHLHYTIGALLRHPGPVRLLKEVSELVDVLDGITCEEMKYLIREKEAVLPFWNEINDAKEVYRSKIYQGVSGETQVRSSEEIAEILQRWADVVDLGIQKAELTEDGMMPTYFSYDVTSYETEGDKIIPKEIKVQKIPHFLEGQVRRMKLTSGRMPKQLLYDNVKTSDLYDSKLHMYKVNASLADASFELGRACSFTPGWLENESIWLHMEYKYLLEILKSGLYREYFADLKEAAIPFLDEEVYGRSILENSSFIASSANPNEDIHGKGFVARLSGSTVEFIHMWKIMMFGVSPFTTAEDGTLQLALAPAIPAYLIPESKQVEAEFLGRTPVTYCFDQQQDYYPGNYHVSRMEITWKDGSTQTVDSDVLHGEKALAVREGKAESITVYII